MGSYGIGLERIVAAAIEQNHDDDGIVWPLSLAPYQVHITQLDRTQEDVLRVGESLYTKMQEGGLQVLLDDRDESPGKKFKDADLIGFPFRVTIGARSLKEGNVEIRPRREKETVRVNASDAISTVQTMILEEERKFETTLNQNLEGSIFT
jgi:prolyl-tRNA synthetase